MWKSVWKSDSPSHSNGKKSTSQHLWHFWCSHRFHSSFPSLSCHLPIESHSQRRVQRLRMPTSRKNPWCALSSAAFKVLRVRATNSLLFSAPPAQRCQRSCGWPDLKHFGLVCVVLFLLKVSTYFCWWAWNTYTKSLQLK